MGLFSRSNDKKMLESALEDFRAERYDEAFAKVCKAADEGSARANFCKALLLYNDEVNPDSTPDPQEVYAYARRAQEGGYAPAYGLCAFLLDVMDEHEALVRFCTQKHKVEDATFALYQGCVYFGMYTEEPQADAKTTIATLEKAIRLTEGKGTSEIEREERALYNPYTRLREDYVYARANFVLMTVYFCEDDWDTRRAFMQAFDKAYEHMPLSGERFRVAKQYMNAILKNVLGMRDLKEANHAMELLNEAYGALSDDDKAVYQEDYDEVYEGYDALFEEESEKQSSRETVYSDGYADKNDLSLSGVADAIVSWAKSGTSDCATTYYEINGRRYSRGDYGELYAEDGIKSGYRVDDYGRLYDEDGDELGYFNDKGLFISGY